MVLETGKRLVERGHNVDCVCIRADASIVGIESGIAFHEIGGPLSSQLAFWLGFRRGCSRVAEVVRRLVAGSPTECVLFPQVFPANWWGSYVLQKLPELRAVWYCQEPSAFIHSKAWINALPWPKNWIAKGLNPILARWDLRACSHFEKVLVNSEYSRQYSRRIYGYDETRCEVVYLGIDRRRFLPAARNERDASVLCVAKLTEFKNIDRVIAAMRCLRERGDKVTKLHVVGTGDAFPSLVQQTRRLGLDDRVVFHGRLEDDNLIRLLQRASALCLMSVDEPFGLVAIEAMACGTPVIAINSGGPAEIIGNTEAGVLLDRPEPTLIAEAISNLLSNNSEFETRSHVALARAADFDWERTVDRLESVFRSME